MTRLINVYQPLYFKRIEARCKCGKCTGKSHHQPFEDGLLVKLDLLRTITGAPITITSGWRCAEHNAAVGGVENSKHLIGRAADIRADDMPGLLAAVKRLNLIYLYKFSELIPNLERGYIHVAC